MIPTNEEEHKLHQNGYKLVAGVDEAGRGPLAGPVVAAAVILPEQYDSPFLRQVRDSKMLTPGQRERLLPHIVRTARAVGVGIGSSEEIDTIGIVPATKLAMCRALSDLSTAPEFLLIDAVPLPESGVPYKAIIRGDSLCISIAAASIVAKVTRDCMMHEAEAIYPGYGFAKHKGYPTAEHVANLERLGPCPIHRRSFAPVAQAVMIRSTLP